MKKFSPHELSTHVCVPSCNSKESCNCGVFLLRKSQNYIPKSKSRDFAWRMLSSFVFLLPIFSRTTHGKYVSWSTLIPHILNLYRLLANKNKILRFLIKATSRFFSITIGSFICADTILKFSILEPRRTSRMRAVYLTKLEASFVLRAKSRWNWIRVSTFYETEAKRGMRRKAKRRKVQTTVEGFNHAFFMQIQRFKRLFCI